MTDRAASQVREEAYRAAAAAVDRFLGRIDNSATERFDQVGSASWDRFRAEMGRVVDLNLDMVRNAFGLYSSMIGPETLGRSDADVLALGPVLPGSEAGAVLWLHNFDGDPMEELTFVGSRLTMPGGESIDLPAWSFSPATVSVPARSAVPVTVGVEVPHDAAAGSYAGTVSTQSGVGEAIEVRVEVVETAAVAHDSW